MKKIKSLVIILLFASFFVVDALAMGPPPGGRHHHSRKHHPVGVPLDGGLLAILGAAGVAYFVARKKKKGS